jgi:hypothetical protein
MERDRTGWEWDGKAGEHVIYPRDLFLSTMLGSRTETDNHIKYKHACSVFCSLKCDLAGKSEYIPSTASSRVMIDPFGPFAYLSHICQSLSPTTSPMRISGVGEDNNNSN